MGDSAKIIYNGEIAKPCGDLMHWVRAFLKEVVGGALRDDCMSKKFREYWPKLYQQIVFSKIRVS